MITGTQYIKLQHNGEETRTVTKDFLLKAIKRENFREMKFKTPIYYAGVYVTTAYIKIQKGDNYCTPANKNKIYTSVNLEGDKVGLRPAQKAIRDADIVGEVELLTRW